jgi:hypothetical protein
LKNKILPSAVAVFCLVIICVPIFPLFGSIPTVRALDSGTAVSKALDYMKTQICDDGSFAGSSYAMTGSLEMTQWVILGIVAAGQDPNTWVGSTGKSTAVWFVSQAKDVYTGQYDEGPVGKYSTYILSAVALGLNPYNINGYNFVDALLNQSNADGVLNTNPGYLNYNWWGVMALVAAGVPTNNSVVQGCVAYIEKYQAPDGGWSYATAGAGDPDDTAMALNALSAAGVPPSSPCITNALEFLHNAQNVDGGFTWQGDATNSASDSWVISGLISVGQDPTQWKKTDEGKSVVDHLLSLQYYNGAFYWYGTTMNNPVWMTAYAVIALCNKTYYNIVPSLAGPADSSTPTPSASSAPATDPDFSILLVSFGSVVAVVVVLSVVTFTRRRGSGSPRAKPTAVAMCASSVSSFCLKKHFSYEHSVDSY